MTSPKQQPTTSKQNDAGFLPSPYVFSAPPLCMSSPPPLPPRPSPPLCWAFYGTAVVCAVVVVAYGCEVAVAYGCVVVVAYVVGADVVVVVAVPYVPAG